jgi:hypothetical protein
MWLKPAYMTTASKVGSAVTGRCPGMQNNSVTIFNGSMLSSSDSATLAGAASFFSFFFAGFPPCPRAACSHEPFENFRVVRGMESNQAHAFPNAAHHRVGHGIRYLAMRCVPPPKQDLGAIQDRLS